jgi:predicted nuclease of predicted toxin-antitoxin system
VNILLDECVPRPLKTSFNSHGHSFHTVPEAGFAGKTSGELLRLAQNRFEVFITLDKGLAFQQNLANLKIAVLVVRAKTNQMIDVLPHVAECLIVLDTIKPGEIRHVGG